MCVEISEKEQSVNALAQQLRDNYIISKNLEMTREKKGNWYNYASVRTIDR